MPEKTARKTTYEWLAIVRMYIFVGSPADLVKNIIISKEYLNMNPYLNIDRLKKDFYIAILNEIQYYKSCICQDYVYGKIQGILEFACEVRIISYSGYFAIKDFVDRKAKYLDRGGII